VGVRREGKAVLTKQRVEFKADLGITSTTLVQPGSV
jgi:hypothetical protein